MIERQSNISMLFVNSLIVYQSLLTRWVKVIKESCFLLQSLRAIPAMQSNGTILPVFSLVYLSVFPSHKNRHANRTQWQVGIAQPACIKFHSRTPRHLYSVNSILLDMISLDICLPSFALVQSCLDCLALCPHWHWSLPVGVAFLHHHPFRFPLL